jgi:hypothetical protein
MASRASFVLACVLFAASSTARASNGFVLGFEFGGGPFSANSAEIVGNSKGGVTADQAGPFTTAITSSWLPDLDLHLGYNVLGHVAVEGVFAATGWSLTNSNRGGGGFAGARVTWYPMQIFFPKRIWDVGIELGGGYSLIGGPPPSGSPTYGMEGPYFNFALTAEIYPVPNVSIEIFYRYYDLFWNKFFLDYNNNVSVPISNFAASWNVIGLGVNFHIF